MELDKVAVIPDALGKICNDLLVLQIVGRHEAKSIQSQIEPRIGFEHCTGLRKRMKRSDQDVFAKRLDVDVTDRTKRKPTVRTKPVHKTFELDLVVELLLDHDKGLGINQLKFDFRLVVDLEPKGRLVVANAFNRMRNKELLGRQRMMSTSTDFGKHQIIMGKRNRVTVRGNVDAKLVTLALDRPAGTNVE